MLTKTSAEGHPDITLRWVRWADADYLGARLLLFSGLLIQGSALANTAIEKYLKAVCSYSNMKIPRSHNVLELYEAVTTHKPTSLSLNKGFLELLNKAYILRYPDDLAEGFNIALNHAKLLSQLDRSVLELTQRFSFTTQGKQIAMVLDEAMLKQDQRFLKNNIALNSSGASALFSMPSQSYDIRIHNGNVFQISYQTVRIADDGLFNAEGFMPQSDVDFKVGYPPIVEGTG